MQDFVHLHVHTQYSILDGQAAIPKLVDKALSDGMRGMAITDHGNMMGVKELFNYVSGVRSKGRAAMKEAEKSLATAASDEERAKAEKQLRQATLRAEFKPIIGCEMYVARRGMRKKETREDQSGWHLVVLAKNERGYRNLLKLVSHAWVDGLYMRPRTERAELEKYHEGLMVCSACLGGEIPRKIIAGNKAQVREAVEWFKRVFGDDFYLELQRHEVKQPGLRANYNTYAQQIIVNEALVALSKEYGVKLVCTNDVHFVDEENAEAHDRLICLSTGKDLDDPTRMLYSKQEWFKTRAEMTAIFADLPEAIDNTMELLNKTEFYSINHSPIMPSFDIPASFGTEEEYRKRYTDSDLFHEFTADENGNETLTAEEAEKKVDNLGGVDKLYRLKLEADYLGSLTRAGAARLYGNPLPQNVETRLRFELHVMKTMGFPGYFLIVQDYIAAARQQLGVSVGPGRGSAAGSVVAYCLGITQIDPLKYDLLFERFLNPDRISLPDIDVDFDDDGRGRVLDWVTRKYGAERVAHIITFSTMATKSAIKDVARVQKLPLAQSNYFCKLVPAKLPAGPDGKAPKVNIPNVCAAVPELREAATSSDPLVRDTFRYAAMLEGNIRGTGVHACGIIICRDDISDWVPVSTAEDKESKQRLLCTQYEGSVIEETGLIKMDFLGLSTLSIIKETLENIEISLNKKIDIDHIPINDPATYRLFCEGRTVGIFQFESSGMQSRLRELQPSTFEDLIAMNALYRPGPMDYIPKFINRKHGKEPITYDLPCMEKYLKDTYGVTVYQEQVMLLSREIAGFTRGESDNLRKAMGKKLKKKLDDMYPKFLAGGKARGHNVAVLEKIWKDWEAFASYAFNKSHATCYSWVAYQTAYLKANYPGQYLAGVLSRNLSDIAKISIYMEECRAMGIHVLGPDINESRRKFAVNKNGDIRFGLAAILGVGEAVAESIVKEREKNGRYTDLFNFMERVSYAGGFNKKALESLAMAGAFDSFGLDRELFLATNDKGEAWLDALIRYGQRYQQDRRQNLNSLFGDMGSVDIAHPEMPKEYARWNDLERLNRERALIGIYLSGHPLDEYRLILEHMCNIKVGQLADLSALAGRDLTLGGIISAVREGKSKNGKPYGIVKIEDYGEAGELPLFGEDWAHWQGFLSQGNSVLIRARVEARRWAPERLDLRIAKVEFLSDIKDDWLQTVHINVRSDLLNEVAVSELASLIKANPGKVDLDFRLHDIETGQNVEMQSRSHRIKAEKALFDFLDSHPAYSYSVN